MKNLFSKILVVAIIGFSFVASASAQEGIKIAVLDVQTALFNSSQAQVADTEIQAETAEDSEKVRELAEQAQALQDRLAQDAAVLSEAESKRLQDQIQEIGVQYQYLVQKLQTLVEERRQQFQQAYAPNLIQAISEVVEEEQYDIVLRAEVALHFRGSFDITAKVTEKLNSQ